MKDKNQKASPESDFLSELARPARRALAGAGINQLDDIAKLTETELSTLHVMGPKALQTIRAAMRIRGLNFASSAEAERMIEQAHDELNRQKPGSKHRGDKQVHAAPKRTKKTSQKNKTTTIDEYIAAYPLEVREILEKIRATIRDATPEAEETINYQIPTFIIS